MPTNKSIFSYFLSGTFYIGIARVSTIVFGLVSVMLATRYLTIDEYGAYVLILLLTNFLVEFMSFGLGFVIPKYLASNEDAEDQNILQNTVFYFRGISVFVGILFILILKPVFSSFFNSTPILDVYTALPVMFFFVSFTHLFGSILRGRFGFKSIGIIELTSEAIKLAVLVVLVVVYNFGFLGAIIAKVFSQAVFMLLSYRYCHFVHKLKFNFPLMKEMLAFGFPLQVQYIFGFAYSKLDTVIVGSLLGASGIALYDIARKIPDSLRDLYTVFISVYFPISANVYAKEEKAKTQQLINHSIRLLTFLTFFAVLVFALWGEKILVLLFSDEYGASYWILVLLMIGLVLDFIESTLGYSLVAINQPEKPLYINIIRAIVSLIGNLIILPILGVIGAAIVNILGNVVAVPINVFFLRRKGINPKFIPPLKSAFIFGLLYATHLLWNPSNILISIFIALMFIPLSFLSSVISLRDVSIVYEEIRIAGINMRERFFSKA